MFNHFPGGADAAGPGTTLGEPLPQTTRELPQGLKEHLLRLWFCSQIPQTGNPEKIRCIGSGPAEPGPPLLLSTVLLSDVGLHIVSPMVYLGLWRLEEEEPQR